MASAIIAWLVCYSVLCLVSSGGTEPQGAAGARPDAPSGASGALARSAAAQMVGSNSGAREIRSEAVLGAWSKVPRHRLVPAGQVDSAYGDHPLPIGQGQTISQPYIVAYMSEAAGLSPKEKVLEIGTGSGYQAAVLGELAAEVYTIEILPELAEPCLQLSRETLRREAEVRRDGQHGSSSEGVPHRRPVRRNRDDGRQ